MLAGRAKKLLKLSDCRCRFRIGSGKRVGFYTVGLSQSFDSTRYGIPANDALAQWILRG
jgi:hypothetical protein